jgi:hypothetical protein
LARINLKAQPRKEGHLWLMLWMLLTKKELQCLKIGIGLKPNLILMIIPIVIVTRTLIALLVLWISMLIELIIVRCKCRALFKKYWFLKVIV